MKPYTPQAKQLHLEICDRADKGEPLLQLLRTFDMHRSRFYHIYRRTRGVKWSQAHPREHLTRGEQWHGTPKQLIAYLNELDRAQ